MLKRSNYQGKILSNFKKVSFLPRQFDLKTVPTPFFRFQLNNCLFFFCRYFRSFSLPTLFIISNSVFADNPSHKSAASLGIISGTQPYLTFDQGAAKADNIDYLLEIELTDGRRFSKETNPSSAANPIEMPEPGQKFSDIVMPVPTDANTVPGVTQQTNLHDLIVPQNYWGDDDGDGVGENGVSVEGTLNLTIKTNDDDLVSRDEVLNGCYSPYKVELNGSTGNIITQYGYPSMGSFNNSQVNYYIKPKIDIPYPCWAQPNLNRYGDYNHINPEIWNRKKGFNPQNIHIPEKNFPTIGFNQAHFKLIMAGARASDLVFDKTPANSSVNITITDDGGETAKIYLSGPQIDALPTRVEHFEPTTFRIYSDSSKSNMIYSFKIATWFVLYGHDFKYAESRDYCANIGYRQAGVRDMTNANNTDPNTNWTGGLPGNGNNAYSLIGQGLIAEWGDIIYGYGPVTSRNLWAAESYPAIEGNQYFVNGVDGAVYQTIANDTAAGVACVMP